MEDNLQVEYKFIKSIIIVILGGTSFELFKVLFINWISKEGIISDVLPTSLHTIWEFIAIIAILFVAKKLKVKVFDFVLKLMLLFIFVSLVGGLIPDAWRGFNHNYYGLLTRESPRLGRDSEMVSFDDLFFRRLLPKDRAKGIIAYIEKSGSDEYLGYKGFIYWQTGLAYGFFPSSIPEFDDGRGFAARTKLILSIGPMVILESLIVGTLFNAPFLILFQLLWFLFRKKYIWWDPDEAFY